MSFRRETSVSDYREKWRVADAAHRRVIDLVDDQRAQLLEDLNIRVVWTFNERHICSWRDGTRLPEYFDALIVRWHA